MKKKMRRFDVGGDVRERAMRYAAMANDSGEESEGQKAMLREQAGREYGMKGEEPPKASASKPAASSSPSSSSSSSSSTSARSKYVGSTNDAGGEGAPRSKYVGSTNDAGGEGAPRSTSRSISTDSTDIAGEAVEYGKSMGREADNSGRINRANYRTTSDRVIEEPDVPHGDTRSNAGPRTIKDRLKETFLSGGAGDVRNIAGALAGPAAGRAATATASGIGKAASEATGAAGAKRVMDAASKRAAQVRAEQAAANRPSTEILRRQQETKTAQKAAETRARAGQKAKSTMAGSAARTRALRARQAERRQDALDEARMGGEGPGFKKGGKVGASRGDGIAQRGHTRGKYL